MGVRAVFAAGLAAILLTAAAGRVDAADSGPSAAEEAALTAPVQRLVDAINHAETAVPKNVFITDAAVLDDFAPYRWTGRTDAGVWYKASLGTVPKDREAFLALKADLSIGQPQFSRITGDAAYFVLPGVFNGDAGKRVRQTSTWLITEKRVKGSWLISGHAWAITGESEASPP